MISEHQVLLHSFMKNHIQRRLALWMEFLAEYEFEVLYRPGAGNEAAEYLFHTVPAGSSLATERYEEDLVASLDSVTTEENPTLERLLLDVARHLQGLKIRFDDEEKSLSVKPMAENFKMWEAKLLRSTRNGLNSVPFRKDRTAILKTFYDYVVNLDKETTKQFVLDHYWWPQMHLDIQNYVESCGGRQKTRPLPLYHTR